MIFIADVSFDTNSNGNDLVKLGLYFRHDSSTELIKDHFGIIEFNRFVNGSFGVATAKLIKNIDMQKFYIITIIYQFLLIKMKQMLPVIDFDYLSCMFTIVLRIL